jgi:N-acetylglucosamine-6-sulfatase
MGFRALDVDFPLQAGETDHSRQSASHRTPRASEPRRDRSRQPRPAKVRGSDASGVRLIVSGRRAMMVLAVFAALIVVPPAVLSGTASGRQQYARGPEHAGHVIPVGSPAGGATMVGSPAAQHPNIVFVLTDDLSMDLLRYMPAVKALERRGITFSNYFVSDSLCCPSRASIFTGNYPHDTHIWTNDSPTGGFALFDRLDEQLDTFNNVLSHDGYRTAMMGKYLNGYLMNPLLTTAVDRFVPAGWSEWDVAGWGYPEYNYLLNDDGTVVHYGDAPKDYLTSVIAHKGIAFINRSAGAGQAFFLELATFAPHTPYVPAPRDRHDFPDLMAPEPPSFDRLPTGAPDWLADHPKLKPRQIRMINEAFRKRAQDVQSVDRMITRVEATLRADHILNNTYIVFSSDNGLHTGEYRLMPGKLTAFDTDIHVPLVIAGPGIKPDTRTSALAENVDLAKTFAAIGGENDMQNDGHTLIPLLAGGTPPGWRNALLVEHKGPVTNPADPDAQDRISGNPPSYEAMRTRHFLYVEYAGTGEREFYNLQNDPYELHNRSSTLTPTRRTQLHRELTAMEDCHSGPACWTAEHVDDTP